MVNAPAGQRAALSLLQAGSQAGRPGDLAPFQLSERSGFYCRVLKEGLIEAGQTIRVIESDPDERTIAEFSPPATGSRASNG